MLSISIPKQSKQSKRNCSEDGIDTWLSAFAIGIRTHDDEWAVYAPYGLDDLLDMKVRPNRKQITKEIYMRMVSSYKQRWPAISVEDWHD